MAKRETVYLGDIPAPSAADDPRWKAALERQFAPVVHVSDPALGPAGSWPCVTPKWCQRCGIMITDGPTAMNRERYAAGLCGGEECQGYDPGEQEHEDLLDDPGPPSDTASER